MRNQKAEKIRKIKLKRGFELGNLTTKLRVNEDDKQGRIKEKREISVLGREARAGTPVRALDLDCNKKDYGGRKRGERCLRVGGDQAWPFPVSQIS